MPPIPSPFQSYLAGRNAPADPPQQSDHLTEAAIRLGLPVFPCGDNKRPLTAHGFKDASTDPATIRRMFRSPLAVMIGVPTGPVSGWYVIDVDIKDGAAGMDWLHASSADLVPTRTHKTQSGGLHLIFSLPDGTEVRNSASKIAPGVDVRGTGGYVIVPPSPGYAIADDTDIAEMPEWLYRECLKEPARLSSPPPRSMAPRSTDNGGTAYGLAGLDAECDAIRTAIDGTKHEALNRAAYAIGGLVSAGELDHGTAYGALSAALEAIRHQCKDFRAACKTLDRAFHEGIGTPRQPPEPLYPDPPAIHEAAPMLAKLRMRQAAPLPIATDIMEVTGILRLILDECTRTAIRPQPFLSLGAAICCIGALAGRRYRTTTDLRTNIYIAAIAESGGGKDHAPEIIKRCIDAAGLDRYLAGETIASGRAVLSSLEHHPAKLFQVDEFGMFLAGISGKKAPSHKAEIWSELMKLYSRAKGVYRGTEYANKKENPRVDIHQPCVAFYGTTTPGTFWRALEGGALADGSLARFLVFVSPNHRPDRNKLAAIFTPPAGLIEALQAIVCGHGSPPTSGGNLPAPHIPPMLASEEPDPFTVPMDGEAEAIHEANLEREDAWAREVVGTPSAPIVNRWGENAAKLALVAAISDAPSAPLITARHVTWAWALAEHCIRSLIQDAERFIADSEFEQRLNRALNIIRDHGPCSVRDLYRHGLKLPARDQKDVLDALIQSGMVDVMQAKAGIGGGRPTMKYAIPGSWQSTEDEC
tara:strand:- start:3711 stop:5981 length:2271 start_codon:yes stop_codon:yes gene_type:complete